jgi:adenylate kinase family enzyme
VVLRGSADLLPSTTRRILVTGASGAGKSTLRRVISDALRLPTVEIDSLYHGPDWTPRPTFAAEVDQFTSGAAWVVEWQYSHVRSLLLARADVLVWLDHGRWTVTRRVVRRTVKRRLRRLELWNGNREPALRTMFTDPEHIIRWSWKTYGKRRDEALAVARQRDGPIVVRLSGQSEVDAWIRGPLRTLYAEIGHPQA